MINKNPYIEGLPGRWYKIELRGDIESDKLSITVDDDLIVTDKTLTTDNIGDPIAIQIPSNFHPMDMIIYENTPDEYIEESNPPSHSIPDIQYFNVGYIEVMQADLTYSMDVDLYIYGCFRNRNLEGGENIV